VDPLTLSALGSVALSEGIRFLYGQASEILKRRRDRSQETSGGSTRVQGPLELGDLEILAGTLEPVEIDFDAADQLDADLKMLSQRLGNYANGLEEVDPTDENLLRVTDALRRVIEAVYQQRITFKGEARPPSGPLVEGRVDVEDVVGYVAGVRAETIESGRVTGEVIANRVESGAEAVGVDVKRIGGRRAD